MMLAGFEGCNLRDDRANSPQHLVHSFGTFVIFVALDFNKITQLAANTALFQTIGRQEALKMTFEVMQKRANGTVRILCTIPLLLLMLHLVGASPHFSTWCFQEVMKFYNKARHIWLKS